MPPISDDDYNHVYAALLEAKEENSKLRRALNESTTQVKTLRSRLTTLEQLAEESRRGA